MMIGCVMQEGCRQVETRRNHARRCLGFMSRNKPLGKPNLSGRCFPPREKTNSVSGLFLPEGSALHPQPITAASENPALCKNFDELNSGENRSAQFFSLFLRKLFQQLHKTAENLQFSSFSQVFAGLSKFQAGHYDSTPFKRSSNSSINFLIP